MNQALLKSVFRIRISLKADPDPGFYLNADADPDYGFQTLIQGLFCLKIEININFVFIVEFSNTFFAF